VSGVSTETIGPSYCMVPGLRLRWSGGGVFIHMVVYIGSIPVSVICGNGFLKLLSFIFFK